MTNSEIAAKIQEAINVKNTFLSDNNQLKTIQDIITVIVNCFKNNGKILFCGNGGSAADAQHLAAELSGKFYIDRPPLAAEALHVNSSFITAVANDYSYDDIYARYIDGMGNSGDVLIGLSTSGNSKNVIKAMEVANQKKLITIGFTGQNAGMIKDIAKFLICVPSNNTPRIQEMHMLVGHIICEFVEKKLFSSKI